jgi:hypothetical protein
MKIGHIEMLLTNPLNALDMDKLNDIIDKKRQEVFLFLIKASVKYKKYLFKAMKAKNR